MTVCEAFFFWVLIIKLAVLKASPSTRHRPLSFDALSLLCIPITEVTRHGICDRVAITPRSLVSIASVEPETFMPIRKRRCRICSISCRHGGVDSFAEATSRTV